ncbi:MAG: CDP-alcohol phosphatidyltransferase family protein [Propionibacteriaceae bacterium]|jgi:phosphatidylglycerophosphate synthase|nr:CDP-alcohol phosphatidyltransferase family protein [Propionibacteriaceae bacterium]
MTHDSAGYPKSYAEFVEVTHPVDIMGRVNAEHWTGRLYLRHISPFLSMPLLRTSVTPNQVTGAFIFIGLLIGPCYLIPGIAGPIAAALVSQFHGLVDCVDGEIARWKRQFSPAGNLLDSLGHFSAEALIPLFIGLRASDLFGSQPDLLWGLLGAITGMLVLYRKSVNQIVQVSLAKAGLPLMRDSSEMRDTSASLLRRLRQIVRHLPIQRISHSVESTLVALAAGIVGLFVGDVLAFRWLVAILAPLTLLITTLFTIQAALSKRLRPAS